MVIHPYSGNPRDHSPCMAKVQTTTISARGEHAQGAPTVMLLPYLERVAAGSPHVDAIAWHDACASSRCHPTTRKDTPAHTHTSMYRTMSVIIFIATFVPVTTCKQEDTSTMSLQQTKTHEKSIPSKRHCWTRDAKGLVHTSGAYGWTAPCHSQTLPHTRAQCSKCDAPCRTWLQPCTCLLTIACAGVNEFWRFWHGYVSTNGAASCRTFVLVTICKHVAPVSECCPSRETMRGDCSVSTWCLLGILTRDVYQPCRSQHDSRHNGTSSHPCIVGWRQREKPTPWCHS